MGTVGRLLVSIFLILATYEGYTNNFAQAELSLLWAIALTLLMIHDKMVGED